MSKAFSTPETLKNCIAPYSILQESKHFSTPKKEHPIHQRISSLKFISFQKSSKGLGNSEDSPCYHQKAQSVFVNTGKLALKIRKLEESIEDKKGNSNASALTQAIDLPFEDNSFEVSFSSEESLILLRKQVDTVKNLQICKEFDSEIKERKYYYELKRKGQENLCKKTRLGSFTDFLLFRSIPFIRIG